MLKAKLEKYLGKTVEITLFDGDIIKGELHKTGEEKYKANLNLYLPRNCYFIANLSLPITCCSSGIFRSSHVTKLRRVDNAE